MGVDWFLCHDCNKEFSYVQEFVSVKRVPHCVFCHGEHITVVKKMFPRKLVGVKR